jgi:hypothetical protein
MTNKEGDEPNLDIDSWTSISLELFPGQWYVLQGMYREIADADTMVSLFNHHQV